MGPRARAALVVAGLLLASSGCGEDGGAGGDRRKPPLTVSAAASLKQAFQAYGSGFGEATIHFSFAGSDELAAQIRQGVRPDVYAAAGIELPEALAAEGLVEEPTVFAANRLVIAVPVGGAKVGSLEDLARPGVKVAMGAESVPVGAYAREVLRRLPAAEGGRILANVRSNEPDVAGVVGKVAHGAVDAGFAYSTDVMAAEGKLEAVGLPARLRPRVEYGVAVVRGAEHPREARTFVAGLLSGKGQDSLRRAGFEPPR